MKMTNSEALEILRKESECRHADYDDYCQQRNCDDCEYHYMDDDEAENLPNDKLTQAIDTAIEALELCVMIEDDAK